ncbi:MAG: NB-ARC domain-containing protein [Sandaracinaceae bacterium]
MGTPPPPDLAPAFRFRLPNPPPVFVGRIGELERLAQLVASGPLGVVTGHGGVGKSALVQEVVHRRLRGWGERCVTVRARKEDDFDQLGVDLLQALTRLELVEGTFDSPDRLAASVIDVAERRRALVVIEDLHHLAKEDAERWLELLASYARDSRWLATTRTRPVCARIQELVVELGPLSTEASLELARSCRPEASAEELADLLHAGEGSPFWIRQLAAGAADGARDLLDGLPQEAVRYLAMLSILEQPVRREHLPAAVGEARRALERRGVIVSDAETHRLHDAAVDHVLGHLTTAERARAQQDAARALGSAPLATAQLEAFRLLLLQRDLDTAEDLLASHRAWVSEGLGPRLWALLAKENDARFATAKLHVALEVASHTSLSWLVSQPAPITRPERLTWIHGLLRSGRSRQAMEELQAILAEAPADDEVLLLHARALCDAGYPQRSVEVLRSIEPASRVERARRDLHLAKALYHADDSHGSAQLLERLSRELEALPRTVARELSGERRGLLMQLGLNDEIGEDPTVETRGFGAQALIFYGMRLAASGRFGGSKHVLARLMKTADLPASSSVLANVASAVLRVPRGEFRGLDVLARNTIHEAEELGNATLYHWAYMMERFVNLGRALEKPELPWAPAIPPPTGVPERYLRVLRAAHAARRGERVAEEDIPVARAGDGPLVECVCQLTEGMVRLVAGDAERAAFLAAQVRHRAVREGYSFLEGEALLIRVCADLSLGRTVELARGVEELSNLAAAFQFRRYRVLARLVGSALEEEPDVPLLLAMREEDASPMAARVAACLLGGPPVRDAMDRLLYEGLSARWRSRVEPLEAGRDPSWVFDPGRRVVYLPERAPSATPLALRILDGLFEAGGAASLPEVARFGWDIDEYHQLRDSKRVHVAIRRLRRAIEDDPSKPTRLVTTEEGYGFCGDAPPARIRPR